MQDGDPERWQVRAGGHEHQGRLRGFDDVGQSVGRVRGVQRQVGAARAHDRVHRDQHVQAPVRDQADDALGPHSRADEVMGQPVHPLGEFGVGAGVGADGDRVTVWIGGHPGGEQVVEGFGGQPVCGGVAVGQQHAAFGHRHQFDIADDGPGVAHHRPQHAFETGQETDHGRLVEQVERVVQVHVDAGRCALGVVAVGERPVQIHLDGRRADLERGDLEAVQPHLRRGLVL
ncbi:Uncharacterised protein [Mycobacteroides abscessus subsp. abscessus]|nr:Uncharacterised protein [Mycobacteroides abscessus subsp. abscessus]